MSAKYALSIAGFIGVLFCTSAIARSDTPPIRHLVYYFTWGSQQQVVARDSNTPAEDSNEHGLQTSNGSGMSHYGGNLNDKGTITVDVQREQPDKGLIVSISEQGEYTRKAPPATCVAYGNTTVICDPDKTVYPEEYTLLRFLASNFVDPTQLDANKHWSLGQSSPNLQVTANYTILDNNNGIMKINEIRSIKQTGSGVVTSDVQTKIGYDFGRLVPTSVDEYITQRQSGGVSGYSITIYQTTLQLQTDSGVAQNK
jgi:hypothetical protein